jgi:hypothetical protein
MSITRKKSTFLLLLLVGGASSCHPDKPHKVAASRPPLAARRPEPGGVTDTAASPDLVTQLRLIRANYRRINAITEWTFTITRALDEPDERGEATFYLLNGQLEKVVVWHLGERTQRQVTYYVLQDQPSLVLEQTYIYDRPINYDSAARNQARGKEPFALAKSTVEESRSYFIHGRLVQQLSKPDCQGPLAANCLHQKQQRLLGDFKTMMSSFVSHLAEVTG